MYEVTLLEPVDSESARQDYMNTLNDESVILSDPELENPAMNPIGEDDVTIDDVLSALAKEGRDDSPKKLGLETRDRSDLEDEGTEAPDGIGCCVGCVEMPKIIGYREFAISGHAGSLVIGCADIGVPGVGVRSVYQTAFLGFDDYDPDITLELDENQIGNIFDDMAKPFKAVAKVAAPIVKAVATPVQFIAKVASGQNIGKAALGSLKSLGSSVGDLSKYASSIASLVPGVGTGIAAALAAGGALAQGKRVDQALIAGVRGAIPGGAIAQAAFDVAVKAASGANLGQAALEAARNNIPGGEVAKKAFDVGLSVILAKKTQEKGLNTPVAVSKPGGFGGAAAAVAAQVKAVEEKSRANKAAADLAALAKLTPSQLKDVKDLNALAKLSPEQQKQLVVYAAAVKAANEAKAKADTAAAEATKAGQQSQAHAALTANVLSTAQNLVKSPAATGMAGLKVNVPGVKPPTLATLGSASEALKKMADARTAINAGESLAAKIRAEGRKATPEETAVLNKAGAARVVHTAAQKALDELQTKASAGDKDAQTKLEVLKIAKNAAMAGAGRHGQLVTDTGQIIRGFFAPA